jgi:hypothetical protein
MLSVEASVDVLLVSVTAPVLIYLLLTWRVESRLRDELPVIWEELGCPSFWNASPSVVARLLRFMWSGRATAEAGGTLRSLTIAWRIAAVASVMGFFAIFGVMVLSAV